MGAERILVVNAGSSSLKAAVYDGALVAVAAGAVSEIGAAPRMMLGSAPRSCEAPDHDAALALLLEGFAKAGCPVSAMTAAGHRVVHGGRSLTRPSRVTGAVIAAIEACIPLAPLHNPHNLAAIRALSRIAPDLPQVACFDTAFHTTNPEVALRYALPAAEEAKGLRRCGFHGISYESLAMRVPGLLGAMPDRVLAFHLGNGASICAIREGLSVATTMGYSPVEGLTMGTRTGAIDAMAVLRLAADHGVDGAAHILNHESGLKGLGGASDMRALHGAGTAAARFAIDHFCYWAARHAGSLVTAMGGLDCIAFTGGIGENDAGVRDAICRQLGYLGVSLDPAANADRAGRIDAAGSPVAVLVIPAEEERHIAAMTRKVAQGADDDSG